MPAASKFDTSLDHTTPTQYQIKRIVKEMCLNINGDRRIVELELSKIASKLLTRLRAVFVANVACNE